MEGGLPISQSELDAHLGKHHTLRPPAPSGAKGVELRVGGQSPRAIFGSRPPAPRGCRSCGAPARASCSRCLSAAYCGRECQTADWKARHGARCARLPKPLLAVRLRPLGRGETSALCSRAEARNESGEGGFYRHPPEAREALGAYLREALGPDVAADDALFVQLVAAAQGLLGPAGGGPLVFAVGGLELWLVLERALSAPTRLMPGYYAPADADAFELARRGRRPGGRWLAGPDSKRRYLGMAPEGPARLPLAEWHEQILRGLREGPLSPEERQQAELHLAVGDLSFASYRLYRQRPGPEE